MCKVRSAFRHRQSNIIAVQCLWRQKLAKREFRRLKKVNIALLTCVDCVEWSPFFCVCVIFLFMYIYCTLLYMAHLDLVLQNIRIGFALQCSGSFIYCSLVYMVHLDLFVCILIVTFESEFQDIRIQLRFAG